ncbi:MAG: OmpP1/FadL family transporter [Bacteroidia bacterium]
MTCLIGMSCVAISQNDIDAIRYSRIGVGGGARFMAMGGSFGALGADISCMSYNPAGLGIYTKGEMIISGGMRFTNNRTKFEDAQSNILGANFVFGNFGMAFAMPSEKDPERRNVFGFSNNQILNMENQFVVNNGETTSSLAKDMLINANDIKNLSQFNPTYELLGYNSYILDYDSAAGNYFSFVDLKRAHQLSRDVSQKGRINEMSFTFAQSVKDNFYFGISLGIPRVKFESTTTHSENDLNDSMNVTLTSSSTFTSTYVDGLPLIYLDKLGFHALQYQEYFKTTGYGLNLKIGGVFRANKYARFGAYLHTPTVLYLTDTYYYYMKGVFDANTDQAAEAQYPDEQGLYEYRITTPMRYGFSGAFILNKYGALNVDFERMSYKTTSLYSENPSDFEGVNSVIKSKYKATGNLRIGAEVNLKPIMLRAGYAYYGSPFGGMFKGPFDRQSASLGIGYRTPNNLFIDLALIRMISKEHYYLYSNIPSKVDLNLVNTTLMISVGAKF